MSEIQTHQSSDFRQAQISGVEVSDISALQSRALTDTVERRNPNVQILVLLKVVWLLNRSDFERSVAIFSI